MACTFWAFQRQISSIFLFTLFIASLGGESGSEHSFSHSNTLQNASSIVVSVKTTTTKTTVAPQTTTTTVGPSTTVPTLPNQHRWSLSDDSNVCILLETGIRMKFKYVIQKTNETVMDATTDVPVEANKTYTSGNCNGTTQTIVIHFFDDWQLALSFSRNDSDGEYHMSHVSLTYSFKPGRLPFTDAAPYANISERWFDEETFRTEVGGSFVCTSQQTLLEGTLDRMGLVVVNFYDTQVEAFRGNTTSHDFHAVGNRCSQDEMNMLVPIIVGACLAGLIVIVLCAYFIGRHQSKRGYENV